MTTSTRRSRVLGALAALTLLSVAVTGCSGSSNDKAATDTDAGAVSDQYAPAPAGAPADGSADGALSEDGGTASGGGDSGSEVSTRTVISTGNVALRSKDVAQARFDVQKVVDRYRGEVSQEQTDTDDDGQIRFSRLVVRIPTERFAEAMDSLETVAALISSDTTTEDVTTQVIDINVRVRVQRRSIARIELLLDRAQSIRDIISIEGQLARRQAQLASLERQQAYLADQTALSTITVSLERTKENLEGHAKTKDATGFVAGLESGWHGLTTVAVGTATVLGALLPFAVVLLVVGIPGWLLVGRLRRRRRTTTGPADQGPSGGPDRG